MVEEPSSLTLLHIEPVDGAPFIGEYLLQVANRKSLRRGGAGFLRKTPNGVDVGGFRERLHQFRGAARASGYDSVWRIHAFENRIKISGDQRMFRGRNCE